MAFLVGDLHDHTIERKVGTVRVGAFAGAERRAEQFVRLWTRIESAY